MIFRRKLELFKSKSQQDLLDAPTDDEVNYNRHSRNYEILMDKDMTRCQSLPDLDNSVFLHDMGKLKRWQMSKIK